MCCFCNINKNKDLAVSVIIMIIIMIIMGHLKTLILFPKFHKIQRIIKKLLLSALR